MSRRPAHRATRPRGMTLVEVLIAMAIFVFAITALLSLFHFGGDQEQRARSHAALAPRIQELVDHILADAWLIEPGGSLARLRSFAGETVPGAPDYHYDLLVEEAEDPDLRRAELRLYRASPERPVVRLAFLLPRAAPLARRLESED